MLTTDCLELSRQLEEAGASNRTGQRAARKLPSQGPDVHGTQGSAALLHGSLDFADQLRFCSRKSELRQIDSKLNGERAGPLQRFGERPAVEKVQPLRTFSSALTP